MKNLLAALILLVVAVPAFAAPTAFKVTFSNGGVVVATATQAGDYRWSQSGALMVVKIQPATFKNVSLVTVSWSGGVSEMTGNAAGDGTAPVMMTVVDSRSKAFDMVTVTPVP